MAGRTRYALSKEVFQNYKGKLLSVDKIKRIISQELASKESRIIEYMNLMEINGIIKEERPFWFRVMKKEETLK